MQVPGEELQLQVHRAEERVENKDQPAEDKNKKKKKEDGFASKL